MVRWKGDSVIKSIFSSCRAPPIKFLALTSGVSQSFTTSAPGKEHLVTSAGICTHMLIHSTHKHKPRFKRKLLKICLIFFLTKLKCLEIIIKIWSDLHTFFWYSNEPRRMHEVHYKWNSNVNERIRMWISDFLI